MTEPHPRVYLARHGETAWTITGQHTGLSDIPLTQRGERNARRLGDRLRGLDTRFDRVFTSPLQRARTTCDLAGFADRAEVDPDLVEWNYGDYDGKTSAQIKAGRPEWLLFRDGCPGGESVAEITARADRVVRRVRGIGGNVLLFSSGHFLRVVAVRWCGLDVTHAQFLLLSTATLSVLGYDHGPDEPAIRLWNDANHVGD